MRRRLFLQAYLALLGIVVLFAALVAVGWWLTHDEPPGAELRRSVAALLGEALPPLGAPRARTDAALARLGRNVDGRITVFGSEGRLLGSLGAPLPAPERMTSDRRTRWSGIFSFRLRDGRTVRFLPNRQPGHTPTVGFLAAVVLLALAVAIAAYPLARSRPSDPKTVIRPSTFRPRRARAASVRARGAPSGGRASPSRTATLRRNSAPGGSSWVSHHPTATSAANRTTIPSRAR